ncbi:MAG: hypothetical protein EOO47_10225, partial [Flavobacterium sp.]
VGLIKDIYIRDENHILLCTTNGVFVTNIHLKNLKKLSTKIFSKSLIANNETYLLNDNELAMLDLTKPEKVKILFSTKSFLIAFNLLDFDVSKNKFHILTDIGYLGISKNELLDNKDVTAKFNIASISLNDSVIYTPSNVIELESTNAKRLLFNIHFSNPEHNNYAKSYSFAKATDTEQWNSFTGNSFLQTNLSPGNYKLKIAIKLPNNHKQITFYQITIIPKFWQTTWFFLSTIIVLLWLAYYLIWRIVNRVQQKTLFKIELENRIAEIENRAFLNQLNPHFLYNALNKLQHFIIQKDTHNGIAYLQRVTSLHRDILKFNQKDFILVREEKEFLERYLYIQEERFDKRFNSLITVDENAHQLKLPPMLIQPLVENVIDHAFNEKKNENFMHIAFLADEDHLKIIISDNGSGNVKNIYPLKDGHAISIIKERLDFINLKKRITTNKIILKNNTPNGIVTTLIIDF